ncbi:extracellular solute-binding protein [Planctomycetota bacterium]
MVIYTALDEIYSRPILESFEKETGLKVVAQYDVESNKTVGLKNRISREAANPQCDVFWNNEIIHSIRLHQEGILQPYISPNAAAIPSVYKDPSGYWTGLAARARVIVFNKDKVAAGDVPKRLEDFADPKYRHLKKGIAEPLFGTTSTHMSVMFTKWGEEKFRQFLLDLKANGVKMVDGNATCMKMVGAGNLDVGFTDSDDANMGITQKGLPLGVIYHNQDDEGTLLIPNTLVMIKNCPHPENAKKLIDYLLRPETELTLSLSPSAQIPLHPGVEIKAPVMDVAKYKLFEADFDKAASSMERVGELYKEIFFNTKK